MSIYSAGADVDAYCSKCKLVLAHVIIAVAKNKPARVECKTCQGVHAYRAAATKKRPKTKRAAGETARRPSNYDEALASRDISRAKRYQATALFNVDDVVDHKMFGLGLVTRVLADDKIEVLYREGIRVMVHNR